MTGKSCRHGGPPWWPTGEPWPPPHHRFGMHYHDRKYDRARFFRRVALAVFAFAGLSIAVVVGMVAIITGRLGLTGWTAGVPAIAVAAIAGLILVAMFGAARRFGSPLREVMDAADRVADGDYTVRVQEDGPPPIRALTHSVNAMTERLQNADQVRRNLMADVAHELRTPLSVLQGRLEGLVDGVYARDDRQLAELLEETHVLSRLIDDLRTLALSDAGALPLQKEPTDLTALVDDVVGSMQTQAAGNSVMLSCTSAESLVLDVDPLRIREVLVNLIANGLHHTPAGGRVTVSLANNAGSTVVTVGDTGRGMTDDELAHAFERFYKGPGSQGSGLGLPIAKGIIRAHGGEITASSQIGTGTTVSFTLPRLI